MPEGALPVRMLVEWVSQPAAAIRLIEQMNIGHTAARQVLWASDGRPQRINRAQPTQPTRAQFDFTSFAGDSRRALYRGSGVQADVNENTLFWGGCGGVRRESLSFSALSLSASQHSALSTHGGTSASMRPPLVPSINFVTSDERACRAANLAYVHTFVAFFSRRLPGGRVVWSERCGWK